MPAWIKKALALFAPKPEPKPEPEPTITVLQPWEDPSRPEWVRNAWKQAEPKSLKKGA